MSKLIMLEEGAKPSTPAAGKWSFYFKADGLYYVDDAGTEVGPVTAGSSLADGDKGDITVSSGATVWTIDANAVTLAKLATQAANTILAEITGSTAVPTAVAVAANKFLARASTGNIAAKDITDFALTILDDANAAAVLATLGAAPTASPTFTGTVILPKTLEIQDTSADHQYVLAVSELTADRTVTLPLLTAADVFVFAAFSQTLTNKRIQKRPVTVTQHATPTWNTDAGDIFNITGLAQAITNLSTNMTGTPVEGEMIELQITDDGTARAIARGTSFVSTTNATMATTTILGKRLRELYQWNATISKWECLGSTSSV